MLPASLLKSTDKDNEERKPKRPEPEKAFTLKSYEQNVTQYAETCSDDPLLDMCVVKEPEFVLLEVDKEYRFVNSRTMEIQEGLPPDQELALKGFETVFDREKYKTIWWHKDRDPIPPRPAQPVPIASSPAIPSPPPPPNSKKSNFIKKKSLKKMDSIRLVTEVPREPRKSRGSLETPFSTDTIIERVESSDKLTKSTGEPLPASESSSTKETTSDKSAGEGEKWIPDVRKAKYQHDSNSNKMEASVGRTRRGAVAALALDMVKATLPYSKEQFMKDREYREEHYLPILTDRERKLLNPTDQGICSQLQTYDLRANTYFVKLVDYIQIDTNSFPLLITLTLFCNRQKKKISEDFNFYWNSQLMPSSKAPETASQKCLFHLIDHSEDMILLCRSTIIDSTNYSYEINSSNEELKKKPKPNKNARITPAPKVTELSKTYRRNFLWGGVRLFKAREDMAKLEIPLIYPKGGMDDVDVLEALEEKHKRKGVEATITFSIEMMFPDKTPMGSVSPSYLPLKPFNPKLNTLDQKTNTSPIIREMQIFEDQDLMYTHYINNLYLYPQKITNWKLKGNAVVFLKLLDKDDVKIEGLPNIYGSPLDSNFTTSARTAISFDAKPTFFDEFKVKLPPSLQNNHHLLFTVYHVDNKRGKLELVGYAIHPLMRNGKISISDHEYELPILSDISSDDYLSTLDKKIHFADSKEKRRALWITMNLISSIIPKDKLLYQFLYHSPSSRMTSRGKRYVNDPLQKKRILSVRNAQSLEIHRFFPVIAHELISTMCNTSDESNATDAFLTFILVIKAVNTESKQKQNLTLRQYASYIAESIPNPSRSTSWKFPPPRLNHNLPQKDSTAEPVPVPPPPPPLNFFHRNQYLFEVLTHHSLLMLKTNSPMLNHYRTVQWFILLLITRSMALYLVDHNKLDLPRNLRFQPKFIEELEELAILLGSDKSMLLHLHSFLIELLCLIDRGVVLTILDSYLESLDKHLHMSFLTVFANYDNYIPLNFPTPLQIPDVKVEWKDFMNDLCRRHFIAGKFLDNVAYFYTNPDGGKVISYFRALLAIHEADPRYNDRKKQIRIGGIYFPFILMLVEDSTPFQNMSEQEKLDTYLCFVYVLRNTSYEALRSWLVSESKRRQIVLLILMLDCLNVLLKEPSKLLYNQASITFINVVSVLIEMCSSDLNEETRSETVSVLAHIINLLQHFFKNGEYQVHSMFLAPINQLIDFVPNSFYPKETTIGVSQLDFRDYLESVTYWLLSFCDKSTNPLKTTATALLYKLIRLDWTLNSSTLRFKVKASIAVAKIIGSQESNYATMNECLQNLKQIASEAQIQNREAYIAEVKEIVVHIETLMQQTELIKQNAGDPEMSAALYHKISDGFSHSPKLRLTWLNNLTGLHIKTGHKAEAGQCKATMAMIIVRYLKATKQLTRYPPHFEHLFESIVPYSTHQSHQGLKTSNENPAHSIILQGEKWTVLQLIEPLEEAARLFEESTLFELCMEVYSLLSLIYKTERKYDQLKLALAEYQKLLDMMTGPEPPDRAAIVYLRIGFYGKKWDEELKGKQFIYKKDAKYNLATMIKQLEDQFFPKYGKENVIVLSKNKSIEELEKTLEEDKLYIQIAGVQPFIDPQEENPRITYFEQNFNIDKFLFETSFAESGTKIDESDLNSIRKKKTVFKTKYPLPYVENRVEVVSSEEFILSPIENAIELIVQQTAKVQQQLTAVPARVNLLQQTLQGSVVPMVNPGPTRICETFLAVQVIREKVWPREHTLRLMNVMEIFVKKCGFAVKLNQYVMEEKHEKFHKMIETSYAQLENTVKLAIEGARKALAEAN